MKKVKIQPLSREEFSEFGEYYDLTNPAGYPLSGAIYKFYPDSKPLISFAVARRAAKCRG